MFVVYIGARIVVACLQSQVCHITISTNHTSCRYYLSNHSGRKITLQANLGTADLNAVFYGSPSLSKDNSNTSVTSVTSAGQSKAATRKHILNVSTYQMCLLMLFNNRTQWTYEDMKTETMIPERELQRALMPLSIGKLSQRVLSKDPKTKAIEPTHVFSINDGFQSKLYKIKITSSKLVYSSHVGY